MSPLSRGRAILSPKLAPTTLRRARAPGAGEAHDAVPYRPYRRLSLPFRRTPANRLLDEPRAPPEHPMSQPTAAEAGFRTRGHLSPRTARREDRGTTPRHLALAGGPSLPPPASCASRVRPA